MGGTSPIFFFILYRFATRPGPPQQHLSITAGLYCLDSDDDEKLEKPLAQKTAHMKYNTSGKRHNALTA